jgi:glutathione S-transferase
MITLGYWAVRGRGQVLRFLLDYTKANWQETTYVEDPKWFDEDKYKLGLHFPNIPYLIDGDVRLT